VSVVVSGGQNRHVGRKSYPFPTGTTYDYTIPHTVDLLRGGLTATYEAIVKSQPWVFSAVTKLTYWSARIPFKVYDGDLSDERERVYEGDLARLMKIPHKRARWVSYAQELWWDYFTHGNALEVKYRTSAGAPPSERWVVPWKYVSVMLDDSDRVTGYKVQLGGRNYALTPSDVIHYHWPRGIAPLQALARTIQVEDAALSYQAASLEQGITPRAAFTTEGEPTESDLQRLREELGKLYAGPEAGAKFALLHSGLKYDKPIGVSAVDLALVDQRKLSREEVASAFDISPPFLGILERATFNNVEELRESMYVDSLGPKLDDVQATMQAQLVDDEPVWDGYYVEYDMGAILKPNPEGQARQALMEQQASTTTIDERRRMRNLKPLNVSGVTDTVLVPLNMAPAGAEPPPASEPGAAARTLADDLTAAAFAHGGQRRADTQGDDDATD
jgi:HK97 family phage portal protein